MSSWLWFGKGLWWSGKRHGDRALLTPSNRNRPFSHSASRPVCAGRHRADRQFRRTLRHVCVWRTQHPGAAYAATIH